MKEVITEKYSRDVTDGSKFHLGREGRSTVMTFSADNYFKSENQRVQVFNTNRRFVNLMFNIHLTQSLPTILCPGASVEAPENNSKGNLLSQNRSPTQSLLSKLHP